MVDKAFGPVDLWGHYKQENIFLEYFEDFLLYKAFCTSKDAQLLLLYQVFWLNFVFFFKIKKEHPYSAWFHRIFKAILDQSFENFNERLLVYQANWLSWWYFQWFKYHWDLERYFILLFQWLMTAFLKEIKFFAKTHENKNIQNHLKLHASNILCRICYAIILLVLWHFFRFFSKAES